MSTTVTTRGSGRVRLTVAFAVNGTVVDTQRMELAGATTYVRAFQHALAEPRCGGAWTVTATTEPAAPGGTVTASRAFPDCPTSATGVRVAGLSVDAAPGRTLRARFAVTASGTGRVPVTAEILSGGSTVATRSAVLSGRRSYTRTLTHAFPERPCGTTVGVRVKAGAHSDVRQVRVTCPAGVQTVEVLRAAVSARGATATVRVVTDNDRPVRLRVVLQVGDRTRTSALTLSGATSYTRTLSFALGTVPCGQTWQVSAATTPAARGGADTLSGRTAACPPPREPAEPSPSASAPDDPPPSIR
ncbi:hypothetical protein [Thermocatellispora tengchongensis]|uniref:hypothetical protein n=1 Tax=Thermocatellispora tengchongensis TaxID=1073253 RepID=UPI00363F6BED